MKILFTLLIIFQIYSKDSLKQLNPEVKLGIYSLVINPLNTTSGIKSLSLNQVNKNENHEEENYNSKITEKALEKQNIPSEYLPLYRKYNWLSPDIKSNTKFHGLSAGLPLSLASLLKKNIPKEEYECINFTLFATGELNENDGKIESIGGLHEKLYAIEQFLINYPEQKKSCAVTLPESQEWEYQLVLSENRTLFPPLFNHITEVKTIFITSLPHDLPLLIEYINSNYSQTSYNYSLENTYSIDTNKIKTIQNNTLKTLLLEYEKNNLKKNKYQTTECINYITGNYYYLDFSDPDLVNLISDQLVDVIVMNQSYQNDRRVELYKKERDRLIKVIELYKKELEKKKQDNTKLTNKDIFILIIGAIILGTGIGGLAIK